MGSILIGLLIAGMGIFAVLKYMTVYGWFGASATAEKWLGVGQSPLYYQLIGIAMIFIGFAIMTGLFGKIVVALFGKLFGVYQ